MDVPQSLGPRGAYRIVGELGRGGFATVYKGYHESLDRYVAIKILRPDMVRSPQDHERFQREARAAARLAGHPHIVTVFDYGEHDGQPFLVLEYVDGQTLDERLRERQLSMAEVEQVVAAIASALDHAHQRQLVHRDIKPSNVLLSKDGRVLLSDFGIAKLLDASTTLTSAIVGTPEYMAPEQVNGDTIDARTDIYAFGVMTYRMLAGRPPFRGEMMAILMKHVRDAPPPMSGEGRQVPPAVEAAVLRALAKDPAERYASAGAFYAELSRAIRPSTLLEQAQAALRRGALEQAEQLAGELSANGIRDSAVQYVRQEVVRLRQLARLRAEVSGLLEAGDWRGALRLVEQHRLRETGDPEVTGWLRRIDELRAAEAARQEAERLRREQETREAEARRQREEEERRAREAAAREAREDEARRKREAEERRKREAEEQRKREAEARRLREEDERRKKEAEAQHAREAEARRKREAEERRAREAAIAAEAERPPLEQTVVGLPTGPGAVRGAPSASARRRAGRRGWLIAAVALLVIGAGGTAGVAGLAGLGGSSSPTPTAVPLAQPASPASGGPVASASGGPADQAASGGQSAGPAAPSGAASSGAAARAPEAAPAAKPSDATAARGATKPSDVPVPAVPSPEAKPAAKPSGGSEAGARPAAEPPPPAARPQPSPAAPPAASLPARIRGKDGVELVLVPAGRFTMGSEIDEPSRPAFQAELPAFYVDLVPVTNARYARFVQEAAYRGSAEWRRYADPQNYDPKHYDVERAEHPVVAVAWKDADAYCKWAGRRLPMEAEWEKAARGEDGRRWPWGNQFRQDHANVWSDDESSPEPDTTRVGKYPQGASPSGALDMFGNVRHWTASPMLPYPLDAAALLRPAPDEAGSRVTRGVSFQPFPRGTDLTRRGVEPVGHFGKDLGFRCAASADAAGGR